MERKQRLVSCVLPTKRPFVRERIWCWN
jgi:hypothetical protein